MAPRVKLSLASGAERKQSARTLPAADSRLRQLWFPLAAAVPLDGAAKAFLKIDLRFVTQMLLRARNIRQRVLHVSRALVGVFHVAGVAGKRFQNLESLVQ